MTKARERRYWAEFQTILSLYHAVRMSSRCSTSIAPLKIWSKFRFCTQKIN